ncbi:MAG TPA: hypothetical protein PLM62_01005 [Zoogloea sp.]|nr:hypothetical protein [Zoogloea sp.]
MRAAHWCLAVGAVVAAFNAAAADKGWVSLQGKTLTQALADQDFGDGVHFAYQFLQDGELGGMNMGKPAQGRWRAAGNELCWRWAKSKDSEECYQVRQRGSAIRLYIDGQEVLSGNLTPLPPNPTEVSR